MAFKDVTPAERERLVILAEECAEIQIIVSKILRFGYGSHHPADELKTSNRELLEKEIGHIDNIVGMLYDNKDVSERHVVKHSRAKKVSIKKYLRFQE